MAETWTIVKSQIKNLKKGDMTEHGQRVAYIDPRGTIYVESTPVPLFVEKVEKSVVVEKRAPGVFDSVILGYESQIEKSADVAEFEYRDGVLRRVDPLFVQPGGNPKPTDATRSGAPASARFSMDASIVNRPANLDAPAPPYQYRYEEPDVTSAGTAVPQFYPMTPGEGGGLREPAMYSPTTPKDRTAVDGVVLSRHGQRC